MERSCDHPPPSGPGSRGMTRLTGASAKGRPAAVRGYHKVEGKTGIHEILAHHKHAHGRLTQ